MRLAWLTDIHLNFLSGEQITVFAREVSEQAPDAVVITGDISEGPRLEEHLELLHAQLARPIYFVLGNHDFYRSSIEAVRGRMARLTARARGLYWLPEMGVVELSDKTWLVGHDGWADGRAGDYERSRVMLNDYLVIAELAGLDEQARLCRLQALAAEAASHLAEVLPRALGRAEQAIVAIHVPPFREACWHEGRISNDEWLPHFTCVAAGEQLVRVMAALPDRRATVLCGHTHSDGVTSPLPNLVVRTGGARYGRPHLQAVLEV